MEARISMITLGVADLDRATQFYQHGLGLPLMESPPGTAFFTLDGTWLGLYPWSLLAEDAGVTDSSDGFRGITLSYNVVKEALVEAVLTQAVDAGAVLVKPAQRASWGGYHGYFEDPDGHLWEVAHNPYAWVGPPSKEEGEV